MKYMKTVVVPMMKKQVVNFITCDLCGVTITNDYGEAEKVVIEHKTGYQYSEEGSDEISSVDMCGKCFDEKSVPWLKLQNCTPRTVVWAY